MKTKKLFENEFCTITDNGVEWVRHDKILNTSMTVNCYWVNGELIKKV